MKTPFVIALALSGLAVAPVEARINQRQHHQQQRIHQGVQSGQLTRPEARGLVAQQARIRRYEAHSRADGPGMTRAERARLELMQDRASANIRKQKHDGQTR